MSIPAKPSLLQNEVQILNAKPRKFTGPGGDNILRPDIADLSDHFPVIPLQTLEVWFCQCPSLTGMEHTGMEHCAPHTRAVHMAMCLERWREERTGSSSLNVFQAFSHVLWLKVYSHLLLTACLLGSKRKLPPPACQVRLGLPSVVCRPIGVQFSVHL